MTNHSALPTFRFHPDPVDTGAFERSASACSHCHLSRGWVYALPIYAVVDPGPLCPWCIADGSAARDLDASFNDDWSLAGKVSQEDLDEVAFRTPGFATFQEPEWPVHHGRPGAFRGETDQHGTPAPEGACGSPAWCARSPCSSRT